MDSLTESILSIQECNRNWLEIANMSILTLNRTVQSLNNLLDKAVEVAEDLKIFSSRAGIYTDAGHFENIYTDSLSGYYNEQLKPLRTISQTLKNNEGFTRQNYSENSLYQTGFEDTGEDRHNNLKAYQNLGNAVDNSLDMMDHLGGKFSKFEPAIAKLTKGVGIYNSVLDIASNIQDGGMLEGGAGNFVSGITTAIGAGLAAAAEFSNPVGWAVGLTTLAVSAMSYKPKFGQQPPAFIQNQNAIDSFYGADKESQSVYENKRDKRFFESFDTNAFDNLNLGKNRSDIVTDNLQVKPIIARDKLFASEEQGIYSVLEGNRNALNLINRKGIAGPEGAFLLSALPQELYKRGASKGKDGFYDTATAARSIANVLDKYDVDVHKQVEKIINDERSILVAKANEGHGGASQNTGNVRRNEIINNRRLAASSNTGRGITININKPLCEINTMNVKEAKEGVQDIKRMVSEAFLEILYSANAAH